MCVASEGDGNKKVLCESNQCSSPSWLSSLTGLSENHYFNIVFVRDIGIYTFEYYQK